MIIIDFSEVSVIQDHMSMRPSVEKAEYNSERNSNRANWVYSAYPARQQRKWSMICANQNMLLQYMQYVKQYLEHTYILTMNCCMLSALCGTYVDTRFQASMDLFSKLNIISLLIFNSNKSRSSVNLTF